MLTAPASLPVLFLVSEAMVIGGIGGLILGNIDKGLSKWKIYRELKKYGIDINDVPSPAAVRESAGISPRITEGTIAASTKIS